MGREQRYQWKNLKSKVRTVNEQTKGAGTADRSRVQHLYILGVWKVIPITEEACRVSEAGEASRYATRDPWGPPEAGCV